MIDFFRRQTELAAYLVRSHLKSGDSAIDATAGNGHDTLMMAQCVGENGHVYAFDVQEEAIVQTRQLLEDNAVSDRVHLFCQGHETIGDNLLIQNDPVINAAMFNLGFLPGGDKQIKTKRSTTITALDSVLDILQENGIITICAYCHKSGLEEIEAIENWVQTLENTVDVYRIETINHQFAPKLYLIRKK